MGGIYELNYVQTPTVSDFGSLNMVWHLNYKNLVVDKDVRIRSYSSNARPFRNQSVLDIRQIGANNLNPSLEALRETIDPENLLFVFVLEIPEYLCYWSEPIVC